MRDATRESRPRRQDLARVGTIFDHGNIPAAGHVPSGKEFGQRKHASVFKKGGSNKATVQPDERHFDMQEEKETCQNQLHLIPVGKTKTKKIRDNKVNSLPVKGLVSMRSCRSADEEDEMLRSINKDIPEDDNKIDELRNASVSGENDDSLESESVFQSGMENESVEEKLSVINTEFLPHTSAVPLRKVEMDEEYSNSSLFDGSDDELFGNFDNSDNENDEPSVLSFLAERVSQERRKKGQNMTSSKPLGWVEDEDGELMNVSMKQESFFSSRNWSINLDDNDDSDQSDAMPNSKFTKIVRGPILASPPSLMKSSVKKLPSKTSGNISRLSMEVENFSDE